MVKTRRNHRNRKSQRKSRRSQRGGGGCAAQYTRNSFAQSGGGGCAAQIRSQSGGALAEFSTGPATLLDSAGMTHAQTIQQYNDIQSLGSVIPRQAGGSRRNRRKQRGGMQGFADAYTPPMMVGMFQSGASRRNRQRRRRKQRGGMMEMKAAFTAPQVLAGTSFSTNNEADFGYGYNAMKGAQGV